jgi:DNA-binding response OmpR family regulator
MSSKRILFVDDEPWGHESLRFALETQGYDCITATDISSAVKILRTDTISVVVTDIMMPGGPDYPNVDSQEAGFHFVQIVKQNWPSVHVICLSVIGDQVKIRGLKRYRVRYLRKGEVPLATAVDVIASAACGKYSY